MPKVLSVEKALDILNAIADSEDGIGTRELGRELGINITTVHNIATTLLNRGYLRKGRRTKRFKLGMRLLGMGRPDRVREAMTEAAMPYVQNLVGTVGEAVLLAALQEGNIVHLTFIQSPHALRVDKKDSEDPDLHATAFGKVLLAAMSSQTLEAYLTETPLKKFTPRTLATRKRLLAELQQVRKLGYAMTVDEEIIGVSAVAVPIADPSGRTIAAIGVSAPTSRFKLPQRRKALAKVQHIAEKIASVWSEILSSSAC